MSVLTHSRSQLSPAHSLYYSRPISCFLSQEQTQFPFLFSLDLLAHDVRAILRVFSLLEMNRPFFVLQDAILSSNLTSTFARIFGGDVIQLSARKYDVAQTECA